MTKSLNLTAKRNFQVLKVSLTGSYGRSRGVQRGDPARDDKARRSFKNYAENSEGDLAQGIEDEC
jgi:hypothetical protein